MFWLVGFALGSNRGSREFDDAAESIAMIICFFIVLAIIAVVLVCPIVTIVGAAKMISQGWTEAVSNLIAVGAFGGVPGIFLGWVMAWIIIPESIAPTPYAGSRWSRREDNYEEKMKKHRKVALITAPIALAVGFLIALVGHFIVTGIMAGQFVLAGVLLIILAVLAIPFSAMAVIGLVS